MNTGKAKGTLNQSGQNCVIAVVCMGLAATDDTVLMAESEAEFSAHFGNVLKKIPKINIHFSTIYIP